jgi:hypothetical protein
MGSSEGAAARAVETSARVIALNLAKAVMAGGNASSALEMACYELGFLVDQGLDQDEAISLIRQFSVPLDREMVEEAIAANLPAGARASSDARADDQELEKTDLDRMNERFAVVRVGGKTRVMEFQESPARRGALVPVYSTLRDFRDFQDKYRVKVENNDGGVIRTGRGTWWVKHPERRQYDAVVFEPGASEEQTRGKLNLWRGFAVEPRAGDCSLYLAHLRDNICSGNGDYSAYLLRWMAWGVQHPGDRPEVAIVLKGGEGTGKGMAITTFGELFGSHFVHITQPSHLTGNFNAHLQACSVLFADEALFAGDRRHDGTLKALITEPTIQIEPKGADTFAVRNCLHVLMASNCEWVIPAGADARRYFVLEVADTVKQDTRYFGSLAAQMRAGGREALLHQLLNCDLTDFNIRAVPVTEALQDQKARSRRGVDLLIEMLATDGRLPSAHETYSDVAITSGEAGGEGFYVQARRLSRDLQHMSSIVIKRMLRREWGCEDWHSGNRAGIRFPSLGDLRSRFDRRHGPQDWNGQESWA